MDNTLRELERRAFGGDATAVSLYAAALRRSHSGLSLSDLKALQDAITGELKTLEFSLRVPGLPVIALPITLHCDGAKTLREHLMELCANSSYFGEEDPILFYKALPCECDLSAGEVCREKPQEVDELSCPEPGSKYIAQRNTDANALVANEAILPRPTFILQFSTEQVLVLISLGLTLNQAIQRFAPYLGYDGHTPVTWYNQANQIDGDTIGETDVRYTASIPLIHNSVCASCSRPV